MADNTVPEGKFQVFVLMLMIGKQYVTQGNFHSDACIIDRISNFSAISIVCCSVVGCIVLV